MDKKTGTAKYFEGIGRRKTSTSRVRIYNSDGTSTINGIPVDAYFKMNEYMSKALRPLVLTGMLDKVYFTAKVSGGGLTGQAGAISLGLARALILKDPELKAALRKEDLVSRDPRMVERKKYHHVKSRKKPQFSKR